MSTVTKATPEGSPVGTATGIVHLLSFAVTDYEGSATAVYGLCGRKLRGKLIERTEDEPTCQVCIDGRDYRSATAAGFAHYVRAYRIELGRGALRGSGMRYGAEVACYGCRDADGRKTVIWRSNESGRMREAQEIARQHYLAAYREHLAQNGA